MLLLCAFDPVFVLAAVVWQLFGDLVRSVWGVRVWIGSKLHESSYPEFVHSDHRFSFPRPEGPRISNFAFYLDKDRPAFQRDRYGTNDVIGPEAAMQQP